MNEQLKTIRKCAVLGFPIKHSKSPDIHGAWFKDLGINGSYEAIECKKEKLKETLHKLKQENFTGCNLTIPLKEEALNIVDEISDLAKNIGAINTICFKENGKIFGTNTDAYGFIENIKQQQPNFIFKNKTALVLGAGGAAKAIIFGLFEENVKEIILTNRTRENAEEIAKIAKDNNLNIKVINWQDRENYLSNIDILVNTTSLGMEGMPELEINLSSLNKNALVTDIVYKPLHTKLLKNAQENGNIIVTGFGMLIYQAQLAFKFFHGVFPKVELE